VRPNARRFKHKCDVFYADLILAIRFAAAKVLSVTLRTSAIDPRRRPVLQTFQRFLRDEQGATAIEYGLICAGVAIAIIAVLQSLGVKLIESLTKLLDFFP
jgi:pilus assembly protein Flp/PilA